MVYIFLKQKPSLYLLSTKTREEAVPNQRKAFQIQVGELSILRQDWDLQASCGHRRSVHGEVGGEVFWGVMLFTKHVFFSRWLVGEVALKKNPALCCFFWGSFWGDVLGFLDFLRSLE